MKTFFLITLLFAQSVLAAGLPKTAKIVLQLDQEPITVQFPKLDLSKAIMSDVGSLVTFSETGNIVVGPITYKMDKTAFMVLKDEKKGLTIENIKFARYRLYSEEIGAVVANIVVDTETGNVTINKSTLKGQVTEWY